MSKLKLSAEGHRHQAFLIKAADQAARNREKKKKQGSEPVWLKELIQKHRHSVKKARAARKRARKRMLYGQKNKD